MGHGGQASGVRGVGIEHYWLVDTRKGQERFTALSLPAGAGEYQVVFDSDTAIHVVHRE